MRALIKASTWLMKARSRSRAAAASSLSNASTDRLQVGDQGIGLTGIEDVLTVEHRDMVEGGRDVGKHPKDVHVRRALRSARASHDPYRRTALPTTTGVPDRTGDGISELSRLPRRR